MSVFPTLRLPFLAAKIVVNELDLADLTALFLCNTKAQNLVKTLRKPVSFVALSIDQKKSLNVLEIIELLREEKRAGNFQREYEMSVNIKLSDDIGFLLTVEFDKQLSEKGYLFLRVYAGSIDQQGQYKGVKSNLKIGGIDVPVVMTRKDIIYTFWDSKQDGFETIGEYLRTKVTSSIYSLDICGGTKQEFSRNLNFVINWMNSTNRIPKYCNIENINNRINGNGFKFIFDNVQPTEEYEISAKLGDEFRYNSTIKSKSLDINPANWFTLENLLNTDCEIIRLGKSKLTNNDLKEYLKQWTRGKFPKLRELHVELQEYVNIDLIIPGLSNSRYKYTRKTKSVLIKRKGICVAKLSKPYDTLKTFEMEVVRNKNGF